MTIPYEISPKADRDLLIAQHTELLRRHAAIRVMNRWGDWTDYSVRLRKSDAEVLLGAATESATWRILIGVDEEGVAYGLQRFDAEDHEWHDALEFDRESDDEALVRRVEAWLEENEPAVGTLVEIDRRMLGI